ncbi:uncharacterized protein LOC143357129 isoform X2 [Halictus rubicundus]|uniref:uncharacterized protein LOC143357129 isoform X2 n=1 Tax=Halictus rubicundus TaxID=77578 RepID=UPI0040375717
MRTVRSKNVTMDLDRELTGIFREVVQFLECLREIKLPVTLENLRNHLLIRSKQTLTTFMVERFGTRTSPEPYLDMNPAAVRPKGLIPTIEKGGELEEYVGAEEPQKQRQQQDYYESFQTVEANHAAAAAAATLVPYASSSASSASTSASASASASASGMIASKATQIASQQPQAKDEKIENTLIEIYASFPAAEVKSKCQKCGPLYRKEGKKLFVFEQYRTCWVGLVGSHLLIYGNDRDSRPHMVLPIRGYMARAAPNTNPRDQRKSESTFEIFCPGSKTFQFVARTPKDMDQWVVKICESSTAGRNETIESQKVSIAASSETNARSSLVLDLDLDPARKEEQYQDVGCFGVDKPESEVAGQFVGTVVDEHTADSTTKNAQVDLANLNSCSVPAIPVSFPGPPLPARIPRRLPSLPVRGSSTVTSYVPQDEEEDDIYHKIEDFRNETAARTHCYGNVATRCAKDSSTSRRSKKNSESNAGRSIGSRTEAIYGNENENETEKANENDTDIGNAALTDESRTDERDESYDDVESLLSRSGPKPSNERSTIANKAGESTKSPQKKSFLGRVRSLTESPRKIEKKTKGKAITPPSVDTQRLSTYDDVSGLINVQQTKRSVCSEEKKKREEKEEDEDEEKEGEESEYTCPPPPRPIYANPPAVADATATATANATTTAIATATATGEEELYDDVSSCRRNYKEQDARQLDRVETPTKLNHIRESARRKLDKSVPGDDNDRPKSQTSFEESEHYQTPRPNSNSNYREHPVAQEEELYDDIAILAEFTARQKEFRNSRDSEEAREIRAQSSPEKRSWNRFVGGKRSKAIDSARNQETYTPRNSNGTECVDDLAATRMNTFQKLINKMENSLGKGSVKATPSMLSNRTHVIDNA